MATIRLVSNEEGERLKKEEAERQGKTKSLLIGAKITDVIFSGIGITHHKIKELSLEKDGTKYQVEIEAEQFYDCITSRLVITDTESGKEVDNI